MTVHTSTEADIRCLEGDRYRAILQGDLDGFRSMCHPDLIYTHSNGQRDTLESYLEKCRQGVYQYHSIEHPIDNIVVTESVAVVAGTMRAILTAGGQHLVLNNSCLAVWVKDATTWKLLAYQPTVLPGSSPDEPGQPESHKVDLSDWQEQ